MILRTSRLTRKRCLTTRDEDFQRTFEMTKAMRSLYKCREKLL